MICPSCGHKAHGIGVCPTCGKAFKSLDDRLSEYGLTLAEIEAMKVEHLILGNSYRTVKSKRQSVFPASDLTHYWTEELLSDVEDAFEAGIREAEGKGWKK